MYIAVLYIVVAILVMAKSTDQHAMRYPSVGSSPVERVLLCDQYERQPAGYRNTATSLPGHLIQLTIAGRTMHAVHERQYELSRGSLMWFHEDEEVRIAVHEAPWRFYTLNFIAPSLAPPPFEQRVRKVPRSVERLFTSLLTAWRGETLARAVRSLKVQSLVNALLADIWDAPTQSFAVDPTAQLWWELETRLRQNLTQPIELSTLERWSGRSTATIARSCRAACSMAPMKRIKQIRMSLARGLVLRSDLSITQIADRVGYRRVHELSRDYRKQFNRTPTDDRAYGV